MLEIDGRFPVLPVCCCTISSQVLCACPCHVQVEQGPHLIGSDWHLGDACILQTYFWVAQGHGKDDCAGKKTCMQISPTTCGWILTKLLPRKHCCHQDKYTWYKFLLVYNMTVSAATNDMSWHLFIKYWCFCFWLLSM